jgi:hypothetical protein
LSDFHKIIFNIPSFLKKVATRSGALDSIFGEIGNPFSMLTWNICSPVGAVVVDWRAVVALVDEKGEERR